MKPQKSALGRQKAVPGRSPVRLWAEGFFFFRSKKLKTNLNKKFD